jgi:hypothetical protein
MVFLSRVKNESVIGQQRKGIGNQIPQLRISQRYRWLGPPRRLLLANDIGNVVGTQCTCRRCFFNRTRHDVGPVLANEFEQLGDLTGQGAVHVSQVAQISFQQLART